MQTPLNKTYIWSLSTRVFHALLVVSVLITYIISDFDSLLFAHASLGYLIGCLFIFRILWGFMDIKYSSFKDFNLDKKELMSYFFNIFGTKKIYIGHNPASSWAVILMIVFGIVAVFTGMLAYGSEEQKGLFSSVVELDLFEDLHELFSNLFMIVVASHVVGVLLDRFLQKSKAVESMISGYKSTNEDDIKITFSQNTFAFICISLSVGIFIYTLLFVG